MAGRLELTDNSAGTTVDVRIDAVVAAENIWYGDSVAYGSVPGTMGYHVIKKLLTLARFLGFK